MSVDVLQVRKEPTGAAGGFAEEDDSDAIVVGVRDRSPVGKALFGSVARSVIRESDRPVTIVSPGEET